MAPFGERRFQNAVAESLVGDIRDVVDAETVLAARRIEILATVLEASNVIRRAVVVVLGKLLTPGLMLRIPVRVGVLVQIAADDGLRLIPLRDLHGLHAFTGTEIGKVAEEVDVVRSQTKRLRHDGVVIAILIQMAIRAGFGLRFTDRVGKVRIDRLRGVPRRRDRRLLDVDFLAIGVGR